VLTSTILAAIVVTALAKWQWQVPSFHDQQKLDKLVTTLEVSNGALDGRLVCGSDARVWKLYMSRFMRDQYAKPDVAASFLKAMS